MYLKKKITENDCLVAYIHDNSMYSTTLYFIYLCKISILIVCNAVSVLEIILAPSTVIYLESCTPLGQNYMEDVVSWNIPINELQ